MTIASLHDINLALRFADKVILMKDGSVYAIGRPHEVLTPENIMKVFNVKVALAKNPRPFIVVEDVVEGTSPMPETHDLSDLCELRVGMSGKWCYR